MRGIRLALLVACCLAASCQVRDAVEVAPAPVELPSAEKIEEIRGCLDLECGSQEKHCVKRFYQIGIAKVFAAFEIILDNPRSDREVCVLFGYLCHKLDGDARRLVGPTALRLAHPNSDVRNNAVLALTEIGTQEESAALVALLSDENYYVAQFAATALVKLGGPNELVALDVWLQGSSHRDDAKRRDHVQKCRRELHQRLNNPLGR